MVGGEDLMSERFQEKCELAVLGAEVEDAQAAGEQIAVRSGEKLLDVPKGRKRVVGVPLEGDRETAPGSAEVLGEGGGGSEEIDGVHEVDGDTVTLRFMRWVGVLLCGAMALSAADRVTVLKAARLFDGKSDRAVSPGLVVVTNNKITAIGGTAPAGAEIIDLGDATLLPGLMDAHTHLSDPF